MPAAHDVAVRRLENAHAADPGRRLFRREDAEVDFARAQLADEVRFDWQDLEVEMRRLVNDGGNHIRENRNRAEVCAGDADEALGLRGIEDGRLEQVVEAVKQHDRLGQKGHGARRGHEAAAAAYEERLSEGLAKVREHAAGGRQAEVELLGADGQGLKAAERHEEEKVLLAQGGLNHGAGPWLKKKRRSGGCSELLLRQVL